MLCVLELQSVQSRREAHPWLMLLPDLHSRCPWSALLFKAPSCFPEQQQVSPQAALCVTEPQASCPHRISEPPSSGAEVGCPHPHRATPGVPKYRLECPTGTRLQSTALLCAELLIIGAENR